MRTGTIFAVSAAVISLSLASRGAAPPKTEQSSKPEPLAVVSPTVVRSLRVSIPRKQLVNALLANASTKAVLLEEASKHGIAEGRISTLATTPLPRALSGDAARAAAQMKADEAAYAAVDWSAGIDMTPTGIPTYGSGKWKVGTLAVKNATYATWQPDILTIPTDGDQNLSGAITCDLELPMEPGLYAVTIRLVRKDGYLDSRWVTYEKNGQKPIQAMWHDVSDRGTWGGTMLELVTVSEIKGYVALVRANPTGSTSFENTGMRKVTSRFSLSLLPFAQLTTSPMGDQVFGGITITRL